MTPPSCVEADALAAGDFRSAYVRHGHPVLIRGLVKDWKAVETWTPAHLADFTAAIGDIGVPFRSTPGDMPRVDLGRIHRGTTSLLGILSDCAASPDQGPEIYVPGLDLGIPLADDIGQTGVRSDQRRAHATSPSRKYEACCQSRE